MQLTDSVRVIKGIGEKAEKSLNKLNIFRVADLLEHYPRGYDEWKPIQSICSLREGEMAAVEGSLIQRPQMKTRGRLKILSTVIQDETASMPVTWFNMPFLRNQLQMGRRYILRGKVAVRSGRITLDQPKIYTRQEFSRYVGKLRPIYPLTSGLTNHAITKAMEYALKETEDLYECLPADIRKRQDLIGYGKALKHFFISLRSAT